MQSYASGDTTSGRSDSSRLDSSRVGKSGAVDAAKVGLPLAVDTLEESCGEPDGDEARVDGEDVGEEDDDVGELLVGGDDDWPPLPYVSKNRF